MIKKISLALAIVLSLYNTAYPTGTITVSNDNAEHTIMLFAPDLRGSGQTCFLINSATYPQMFSFQIKPIFKVVIYNATHFITKNETNFTNAIRRCEQANHDAIDPLLTYQNSNFSADTPDVNIRLTSNSSDVPSFETTPEPDSSVFSLGSACTIEKDNITDKQQITCSIQNE